MITLEKGPYTNKIRRIIYYCKVRDKKITFLTNNMELTALDVADLYKERWKIELFFKWIKQNLKIKTFLGTSQNAVKTQIIIALIAYLILKIINKALPVKTSLIRLANLVKANIFHNKTWIDMLKPPDKIINNNNLEQLKLWES